MVASHGRSAPAVSRKMCVQPLGAVAPAGQRVTSTPSWNLFRLALRTKFRSTRSVVPADVNLTSASPSPSVVRPAPTFCRLASIAPKYDGVAPKCPVHRFTWAGSHARPSTAMVPSLLNVIAGSLFPVEFAFGAVVIPGIERSEIRGVLLKAGPALAPVTASCRTAATVARAANAPSSGSLLPIRMCLHLVTGPTPSLRLFPPHVRRVGLSRDPPVRRLRSGGRRRDGTTPFPSFDRKEWERGRL